MPDQLPFKVTLGVTGGIAAYKSAELVRALQQHGLDVHVVMTRAAEEFVRPLTFAALTGHKVITSLWKEQEDGVDHIAEAQSTNLLLIAPATAHTLAKFAHGLADDFLSTLYLATTAPVVIAPAMNVNMWDHPATQANLATLRERGHIIIEPSAGYLACGMTGSGRLAELDAIVAAVLDRIHRPEHARSAPAKDLAGEKLLITAGGTREPIDPVRYLGNRSSGRMGYALAAAALARGACVTLISAPTSLPNPDGCNRIDVTTTAEMHAAVLAHLPAATIVIKAAAVSDFRPAHAAAEKIHRTGPLTLTLEPTEDIAQSITQHIAAHRQPGTLVIAFAAETENVLANARAKLARKGVDAIVANDVSAPGLGFDSERNAATFITPTREIAFPAQSKSDLASHILDEIVALRAARLMPSF